jgi:hypothetical protein
VITIDKRGQGPTQQLCWVGVAGFKMEHMADQELRELFWGDVKAQWVQRHAPREDVDWPSVDGGQILSQERAQLIRGEAPATSTAMERLAVANASREARRPRVRGRVSASMLPPGKIPRKA